MDVEHTQQPRGPPSSFGPHRLTLDNDPTAKDHFPEGFDYTMRRHSIAAVQSSDPNHVPLEAQGAGPRSPFHPSLQGIKRKISHGSIIYNGQTPVETEFQEPFRSPMDPEPPKRRGSAFDTRGMAQMSLNERRDSVDSGQFAPPNSNWWERRDSTTSVYSNASVSSMGGYTSSYSGDGKQPWPPINRNPQTHLPEGLPTTRQYSLPDNRTPTAAAHASVPYPDRRMSVPDATIAAASAVRNFRSRSRPPSRGVSGSQSVTPPHLPQITATLVNPIDGYAETGLALPPMPQGQPPPVPGTAQQGNPTMLQAPKDSPNSTTPYSRSPELRISHKLAERKRRREMKELFDELRDNLPADRGMKSSKWEILSKAIDYIGQIRSQHHEMAREIEALKNEIDVLRGGHPTSNGHHSYAGSLGYQQGYGTTPPSRSSHYPAAGPPPPAL
ncbi:hypothetical protein CPB86DRAFT_838722 [Serendipita vermifera]|nr:hypothetical protein CPB86DRAFT_838722 [Serendipita vermifera]